MSKSGIFVVDKPTGFSTNQLIQKIKRQLNLKKVGHAGTLDPLATGVVIVLINQATKLSDYLLNEDKSYLVKMRLFQATTTADQDGEISADEPPFTLNPKLLKRVIGKYQNYTYQQTPPLYSAIKIKGKKLYQYARKNEPVVVHSRPVTIQSLELLDQDLLSLTFKVHCSKGTYVRSLVEDIARDLKTIGHVQNLTRLSSGNFTLQMAKPWTELKMTDLISLPETLKIANQPIVVLQDVTAAKKGQKIQLPNCQDDEVFISHENGEIIAIYHRLEPNSNWFICKRGGMNLE